MNEEQYLNRNMQFQENLARDNQSASMGMQGALMSQQMAQAGAVLVAQTNPNKVVKEIEFLLRNWEIQPNGQIVRLGEPYLSDFGINRALLILRSMITQANVLSHLDEKRINLFVIDFGDAIADDLARYRIKYGIKEKTMLDMIHNIIVFNVYTTLMRSWEQNEKNWLKGLTIETINTGRSNIPEKKGGFFDKFKL